MRRAVLGVFVALIALVAYSQQAYTITDVRQIAAASTFYTDGLNPTNIYYHTDGTKYVIGSFKGTFVFNSVSYAAFGTTADMYILKYNADGSPAFAKVIPIHSASDALTKNLKGAVAADGSFYITANGNAAFTIDGTNVPAASGVLLKLGTNGVLQWYRTVTGVGLFGVRVFSDNTIAVIGMGSANATWKDEGANTLFTSVYTNTGFYDMLYYRFTSAGSKMWEYRRQETATSAVAPAPTNQFLGKDDSIYSAFVRKETVSTFSVVLEKINPAGTFAWATRLTTQSSNIDINGVSTDTNGNVYLSCTFVGSLGVYHASGTLYATILQSGLYPTAFIGMYNSAGTVQWSRKIIDTAKATAAGISYNNGALALVGYFSSTIKWNDGGSDYTILNKTSATTTTDGYILIIDSTNGNLRQAQGVASNASDYMINIRSSGYGFDMYAFLQGQVDLGSVTVSPVAGAAVGALFHFEDMTCHQFNTPVFGSVKPVVTAALTPGSTQSITISVTMYRQSLGNSPTPVYFNLDSKDDGSAVCRSSSDNIVGSAGVNWALSTDGCSATYTITQSLSQIVDTLAGNNKWVASLGPDGRSIVYSLPIFATYSVNDDGDCYFAGYKSVVTFRTALSVASTTASFVTADGAAKFTFSGLRITTDNKLEVQGTIAPMIQNSEIKAITLSKGGGGPTFTSSVSTCNVYNTGCAQTYTADVAAFGGAGTDISGPYNTVMDFYENGVLTRPGSQITYTLNYIIPSNPNVVDSDTITTSVSMYTDNTYNTVRTASYNTGSGVLYVKNAVSNTSPTIPTGYRLRYDHGYLCCVNYLTSIPAYDPVSDTGGCRANTGKVEWVDLGTEGINTASVQHTASNTVTPKQYNLQVALAGVFQTMNHANPLTCEVLLISKLDNTGARKSQDANLNDVYVSTTQILVEAKAGAVSSAAKTSVAVAFALVAAVVALVL